MTDYHASFHLLERTSEQKVEKNRQTFLPNVDQMFYSPDVLLSKGEKTRKSMKQTGSYGIKEKKCKILN